MFFKQFIATDTNWIIGKDCPIKNINDGTEMENEIVATQDGVISSVNVAVGDTVEAGDVLATLE